MMIHTDQVRNISELKRDDREFILHELISAKWCTNRVYVAKVNFSSGYANLGTLDNQIGWSLTFEQLLEETDKRYLTVAAPELKKTPFMFRFLSMVARVR